MLYKLWTTNIKARLQYSSGLNGNLLRRAFNCIVDVVVQFIWKNNNHKWTLHFLDWESADERRIFVFSQNERYIRKLQNDTNFALVLWVTLVLLLDDI